MVAASGASINSAAGVSVGDDSNISLALLFVEEPQAVEDLNIVERLDYVPSVWLLLILI